MSSHIDEEKIIENFEWSQLSLERLKLLQSQITKEINIKIQEKLTKGSANFKKETSLAFKVSLAKTFPHSIRGSLSEYDKCVFPISLGSKNFYTKPVEACIKWISYNFKNCLVLVGDSVHRLTIQVREGIKEDEARLKAIHTAEKFVNENYLSFQEYSEGCQFEFKMLSEIAKRSDFNIYYDELQSLYQKNESFQSMVNSFAQSYLNRVKQVEVEDMQELKQKHLATTYLLEESALFSCIAKEGWLVFLYPGSIKTFEEISEGLHPEVPEALKQIIWVSLGLKRLNYKSENEK